MIKLRQLFSKKFQLGLVPLAGIVVVSVVVGIGLTARWPQLAQHFPASSQLQYGQSGKPDFGSLAGLYEALQAKYDGTLDPAKILDGARSGLVSAAGDPYTTYLTNTEAKNLNDTLNGTLSGIGIEVGIKNNVLTVIAPVAGTPAAKAGLKSGDVIASIDGADTSQMTLDEAVAKIRGKQGTQVKLVILRGKSDPQTITITRDVITVPTVKTEIKPGNIGYVTISEFGTDTTSDFNAAAKQLQQAGIKKVVLDLRDNPGGYLDAAVSVASHFLPKDQVVVTQRRGSTIISSEKSTGGELEDTQVVVLVNGGSASASEILAGALQDNHRGTLVGATTFGKGSVQEVKPLSGGAELKVTVAHWYTPNGRNITKEGIKPDVAVVMTSDDSNANRDPQLDAALKQLQ